MFRRPIGPDLALHQPEAEPLHRPKAGQSGFSRGVGGGTTEEDGPRQDSGCVNDPPPPMWTPSLNHRGIQTENPGHGGSDCVYRFTCHGSACSGSLVHNDMVNGISHDRACSGTLPNSDDKEGILNDRACSGTQVYNCVTGLSIWQHNAHGIYEKSIDSTGTTEAGNEAEGMAYKACTGKGAEAAASLVKHTGH